MKEFKLNKNSWHFKLATKFGIMESYESDTTICRYFWSVVLGGFVIAFLSSLCSGAGMIIGWTLYSWYIFITTGVTDPSVAISIIVGIVAALGFTVKYAIIYYEKRRDEKWEQDENAKNNGTYVEPELGFLKQAYTSWKEKTCHKIVFTYKHD